MPEDTCRDDGIIFWASCAKVCGECVSFKGFRDIYIGITWSKTNISSLERQSSCVLKLSCKLMSCDLRVQFLLVCVNIVIAPAKHSTCFAVSFLIELIYWLSVELRVQDDKFMSLCVCFVPEHLQSEQLLLVCSRLGVNREQRKSRTGFQTTAFPFSRCWGPFWPWKTKHGGHSIKMFLSAFINRLKKKTEISLFLDIFSPVGCFFLKTTTWPLTFLLRLRPLEGTGADRGGAECAVWRNQA